MEPPVVNKPRVNITPKITKISSLAQSAEEIKRTSTKLRKTFESGAYQKKTQLTVLNRYKKRLDLIQKQNDKRFLKKQRVKIKLPEIKKFAGNFFTAGSDPLKSIGALAAFNALSKGVKGDLGGAIGPALVAAGLFFGPSLLKGGINLTRKGKSQSQTTSPSGGGLFRGTPYSETRAGKSYASMQQFRNLPKWAQGMSSSSASRFAASNERIIQGTANIGDRLRVGSRGMGVPGIGGIAENIAARGGGPATQATTARTGGTVAAKMGGVGARAVPLLGTALNLGLSAYRFGQGDVVGGILSALSAIPVVGWAALGVDLAREFGAFDGTILGRKGQDRLQKQTEEQKKLVERKEGGTLTFGKSLDRYEKVVNKFEEFSKSFTGGMGETLEQTQARATKVENLIGDQDIIAEPGYEFTNYTAQYLTGDPSSPAYDESHGTSSNYHDHIAFSDRNMAIRAYQYLESKGLDVTEFQGFDSVGGHSRGSYHYSGLAFDVPGYQWGATGPIDQRHYNGSRLVRKYLNEFFQQEKQNNPNIQPKNSTAQRTQTPTQSVSSVFQRPQTSQTLSIGAGGFNVGGRPAASSQRVTSPSRPSRSINQYTSYDPRGQMNQVIPVAVPIPQQQMMQAGGSESMILPGPSEQDLLNSFYKRVLLNTVA